LQMIAAMVLMGILKLIQIVKVFSKWPYVWCITFLPFIDQPEEEYYFIFS
jgi:hypothetical protein